MDRGIIAAQAVGEVVLRLPLPPSMNDEPRNPHARDRFKNKWSEIAYEAWLEAQMPKFDRVLVRACFYVWNYRDEDNSQGLAFKGIIDGLKGHLMPDDSPRYMRLMPDCQAIDRKNQRLELRIRPFDHIAVHEADYLEEAIGLLRRSSTCLDMGGAYTPLYRDIRAFIEKVGQSR